MKAFGSMLRNGKASRQTRLHYLLFFLPPPHPPLSWTGLSRKDIRSFFDGATETSSGDGNVCPGNTEGNRVNDTCWSHVEGGFSLLSYRYDNSRAFIPTSSKEYLSLTSCHRA